MRHNCRNHSLIIIVAIIILGGLLRVYAQADDEDIIIPFELEGHGIIIDVSVNDYPEPLKFIFDTGGRTLLDIKAVEKLGLGEPQDTISYFGYFKRQDEYRYILDSLKVGPVKKENIKIKIIDFGKKDYLQGKYGFIGPYFFENYRFTIDYKKKKIILTDTIKPLEADRNSTLLDFSSYGPGGSPNVKLIIGDSLEFEANFDTGSPRAVIMPESYMDSVSSFLNSPIIKSKGAVLEWPFAPGRESSMSRLNKIQIGNIILENIPVVFHPMPLVVGKEILDAFRITYDYPGKRIMLTRYEGEEIETNVKSFGINHAFNELGYLIIKGLWEGSPADKAGILPSDKILKVNDVLIDTLSKTGIIRYLQTREGDSREYQLKRADSTWTVTLHKEPLLPEIE